MYSAIIVITSEVPITTGNQRRTLLRNRLDYQCEFGEVADLEFLSTLVDVSFVQLIVDDLGVCRTWIASAFHRISDALH